MLKRIYHGLVLLAFLAGLFVATPATHASAKNKGISPEGFINPDGTLATDKNFNGSFDLAGWDVQMDPTRGPVFNKAEPSHNVHTPLAATGQWTNVGGWSGPIMKAVGAIAVIGTDVYVGGQFTDAGSIPEADYVARWDGSNWYALGSNGAGNGSLNSTVNTLAVNGSDLYVGGQFTNVNNGGTSLGAADYIAKWNGTNWSALGSNGAGNASLSGQVSTIAISGSDIYAGGFFTDVNNNGSIIAEADYIAKFDGSNWSALGNNGAGNGALNSQCLTIVADGLGSIYAGGAFSNAAGIPEADSIAKWNGSAWSALSGNGAGNGSLIGTVYALAFNGTDLFIGGAFANINNNGTILAEADVIAKWDGTNWSALGSNGAGNGSITQNVYALAVNGTDLYVGGGFANVNNNGTVLGAGDALVKWDGTNWSALGSNGSGSGVFTQNVYAIGVVGGSVYAGGAFMDLVNNGSTLPLADFIARFDGTNWSGLGNATNGSIPAAVNALATGSSSVYVGGNYFDASNSGVNVDAIDNIGAWDGTNWSAVGSGGINSTVNTVFVNGTDVYVGGNFTNAGGIPAADYIAKWNGASWSALGSNGAGNGSLNGGLNGIVVDGSNVYVAGSFTNVNNGGVSLTAADFVAKWDGANWSALGNNGSGDGSINNGAWALAMIGSDLYVGGFFTDVNNGGTILTAADKVAKWDGTNWSALGSNGSGNGSINGTVYALKASGTDLYVGGGFSDVNNGGSALNAADSIAKWNTLTNTWSALGDNGAGNGAITNNLFAIAIHGTDVYVGGDFTNAGGIATADYIAKWNGTAWSALGSNGAGNGSLNGRVSALTVWNSDLYVGGQFTNVNNSGSTLHQADFIAAFGINTAPTDISLSPASVAENQPAATTVGALTTTDVNPDSHTYSIACTVPGADDASFQISGSNLQTAAMFDYETKNSYSVCVRTNDGQGGTFDETLVITVTDVNENSAPTNIALSNSSVAENQPAGTTVGALTTTDVDPDSHTYSFACTVPGSDDASFHVSGSNLQTAASFDYETKNSYNICLRTDDGHGGTFDKNFVISVTDVTGVELIAPANNTAVHNLRPSFDWNNFAGAIGYQIQVSKVAGFNTLALNVTLNGASNSQYVPTKDLTANTLYYWRVRHKISAIQYGPWTTAFTFTTGNPPSVPSLLSPASNSLVTNTSPTLDWSDSTVPAGTTFSHYQVQVDDNADFSSPAVDSNNGPSSMVVGPLSMNTKYYWRVRAWNTAGDYSNWSTVRNFREAMPAPALLSPIGGITVGSLTPLFDWSDVAGATGYTIQVSLSNTFNSFAINITLKTPTSQYTHAISLQAGKTYFWRVRTNGANGPSAWSTVEMFVTP